MKVKPWLIATNAIDGTWPAVKHFIEKALVESSGRINADDVLKQLKDGGMQLWMLVTAEGEPEVVAVLVTEIIMYPRKSVLDLSLMAGDRMDLWLDSLPLLEQWAQTQGVDQVQIHGRSGWARVAGLRRKSFEHVEGYHATSVVLLKDLEASHG